MNLGYVWGQYKEFYDKKNYQIQLIEKTQYNTRQNTIKKWYEKNYKT